MPCTSPLPIMYVPKSVDERRVANFMKKKWPILTQMIGKPESIALYFSAFDFSSLFARMAAAPVTPFGCRMYFASYCLTGEVAVDNIVNAGYDKQLTLIFAPTDNDCANGFRDLGVYYMINPSGGVLNISPASARSMVMAYHDYKLPVLEKIAQDAGIPNFQEGRAMWIGVDAFTGDNGLIPEMTCQGASGLCAAFAAYGKDETAPSGAIVSWELTVVFILAKQLTVNGKTYTYYFDIEDIPGFDSRPPKPITSVAGSGPMLTIQFDTINPCPPATNCGTLNQP